MYLNATTKSRQIMPTICFLVIDPSGGSNHISQFLFFSAFSGLDFWSAFSVLLAIGKIWKRISLPFDLFCTILPMPCDTSSICLKIFSEVAKSETVPLMTTITLFCLFSHFWICLSRDCKSFSAILLERLRSLSPFVDGVAIFLKSIEVPYLNIVLSCPLNTI